MADGVKMEHRCRAGRRMRAFLHYLCTRSTLSFDCLGKCFSFTGKWFATVCFNRDGVRFISTVAISFRYGRDQERLEYSGKFCNFAIMVCLGFLKVLHRFFFLWYNVVQGLSVPLVDLAFSGLLITFMKIPVWSGQSSTRTIQ